MRFACLVMVLAVAGCARVHLGVHDAGGDHDAGPPVMDGGEPCGPTVCAPGTACCDSSCGICSSPDGSCPAIGCPPGCASDAECLTNEYCNMPGCFFDPTFPGTCEVRPDVCVPEIFEVCGCDGVTYTSPCDAAALGMSILHEGPCTGCPPQDARGEGDCPGFFGWRWNGQQCEAVGGCGCIGADCGVLFSDALACESAHVGCASCDPQDAAGEGMCGQFFGYAWNGTSCELISGCGCVGVHCATLYRELEPCSSAHSHCVRRACASSAECDVSEYCHFDVGSCERGMLGECRILPPEVVCAPGASVCGCDGITYPCEDQAYASGASVRHFGPCRATGCAAMDATGTGICATLLGVRWNGTSCQSISGCDCTGSDCPLLLPTLEDCQIAYAGCELAPGGICDGSSAPCRPDEWCDFSDPHTCGASGETGMCQPRPLSCDVTVIDPICGCDGVAYSNPCEGQRAGVDARSMADPCGVPMP